MAPTVIEPTTSSSRNDRANHQVTPRCCSFEAGAEATVEHNRGSNEAKKYFSFHGSRNTNLWKFASC